MKTYLTYQTEDFVQDPYFRKWALGELPAGDRFWETWQSTHPDQFETLEKAKSMVVALRIPAPETDPAEIREAIDLILDETAPQTRVPLIRRSLLPVAASVLFLLGLAYWLMNRPAGPRREPVAAAPAAHAAEQQEINDAGTARVITLPDSSRVTLEGHSTLRIGRHFGKASREVHLTGAAFFDVKRNPEKPFIVYSGKVVTKVLGTSFRIKAYDSDANVSVGVRTGKVTVFRQTPAGEANPMLSEEVVLTPNQQAVFVKKEEKFVKTLVEKPVALNRKAVQLDFSEAAIPVVFNALEQLYGVRIIHDPERLKDCNLTGSLNDGSLYDKLNIVCETIQASYKVMDGQIVIDGKGCK